MRTLGRYLLFQAVGWALGTLALAALVYWDVMALWLAGVLLALLVAKDLILFPYVRKAYEPSATHGGESLLGAVARVERSLTPDGWVRLGAESWRARVPDGTRDVKEGEFVEVREIDSLVLVVEPVEVERSMAVGEGS